MDDVYCHELDEDRREQRWIEENFWYMFITGNEFHLERVRAAQPEGGAEPDLWFVPEMNDSFRVGRDLFRTNSEALNAAVGQIQKVRRRMDEYYGRAHEIIRGATHPEERWRI